MLAGLDAGISRVRAVPVWARAWLLESFCTSTMYPSPLSEPASADTECLSCTTGIFRPFKRNILNDFEVEAANLATPLSK